MACESERGTRGGDPHSHTNRKEARALPAFGARTTHTICHRATQTHTHTHTRTRAHIHTHTRTHCTGTAMAPELDDGGAAVVRRAELWALRVLSIAVQRWVCDEVVEDSTQGRCKLRFGRRVDAWSSRGRRCIGATAARRAPFMWSRPWAKRMVVSAWRVCEVRGEATSSQQC